MAEAPSEYKIVIRPQVAWQDVWRFSIALALSAFSGTLIAEAVVELLR